MVYLKKKKSKARKATSFIPWNPTLSLGGQRASTRTIHLPYSRSPPQSRNTGQTQDRHKAGERKGGEQTEEEVQLTRQLKTLLKESQSTLPPEWWVKWRMTHFVFMFWAKVRYYHWGCQGSMTGDQSWNDQPSDSRISQVFTLNLSKKNN